jgi:hypothetical protein
VVGVGGHSWHRFQLGRRGVDGVVLVPEGERTGQVRRCLVPWSGEVRCMVRSGGDR